MTGTGTMSLRRMAVASAAAILRVGAVLVAVLALSGCSSTQRAPAPATSSEVTTSLASVSSAEASEASSAAAPQGAPSGLVPIEPGGSDSDLVRDELPGYAAQPLQAETYALRRSYVPADTSTHELLTVLARRYADRGTAETAVAARVAATDVSGVERTPAAGLPGYWFIDAGDSVLVLQDGSLTLELRMRPGRRAEDLRKALVEVAETLLD